MRFVVYVSQRRRHVLDRVFGTLGRERNVHVFGGMVRDELRRGVSGHDIDRRAERVRRSRYVQRGDGGVRLRAMLLAKFLDGGVRARHVRDV